MAFEHTIRNAILNRSKDRSVRMDTLLERKRLSVLRGRRKGKPDTGPLVVVFNSRASVQPERAKMEFKYQVLRQTNRMLQVFDHDDSWYNLDQYYDRMIEVIQREMERTGVDSIITFGSSMGAYAAMSVAADVPVSFALAMAPRFSPNPDIVADNRREEHLRELSPAFVHDTAEAGLQKVKQAVILHGRYGNDRFHIRHFPRRPEIDHWIIPTYDHLVAAFLKRDEMLTDVTDAALAQDRNAIAQILKQKNAIRATSLRYRAMMLPRRLKDYRRGYDTMIGRLPNGAPLTT